MTRQLRIGPFSAPRIDETGLHAVGCECRRCEDGFRPSDRDRERARAALLLVERAQRKSARVARSADATRAHLDADARALGEALSRMHGVTPSEPPPGGFREWMQQQRRG